jgi:hypothetical protein
VKAPPPTTRRLFPDEPPEILGNRRFQPYWTCRLLEEGEERDLRWLTQVVAEEELARWLQERGDRQLSRRSRAFWQCLLGARSSSPSAVATQLWPL